MCLFRIFSASFEWNGNQLNWCFSWRYSKEQHISALKSGSESRGSQNACIWLKEMHENDFGFGLAGPTSSFRVNLGKLNIHDAAANNNEMYLIHNNVRCHIIQYVKGPLLEYEI